MAGSEVFIMGTGFASGEGRAMKAVQQALESPLLDSSSIKGTKDILLNIISGTEEITMGEIGLIIDYLQDEAGQDATIIWGNGIDPRLGDQISVTIIATGFDVNPNRIFHRPAEVVELRMEPEEMEINLDDEIPFEMTVEPVVAKEVFREEKKVAVKEEKAVKPKKNKKSELVENGSNEDNDSWFLRQFNRFFEDKDSVASGKKE
jgi:cell division protein FtsZ